MDALEDNATYAKALSAKKDGQYNKSLRLLRSLLSSHPSCKKLTTEIQRVIDVMYGAKGSDGTISLWHDALLMTETEPPLLQSYAWVQVGRKIYRHGGIDAVEHEDAPSCDELWEFDIDERKWTLLETTGGSDSPGPRGGHTMFTWKNDLYIWGGMDRKKCLCSKLYRLKDVARVCNDSANSAPLAWEVVRIKSRRPSGRKEHAGVLYKNNYYVMGGWLGSTNRPIDDLWVINMSNFKWTPLKCGPVGRHCHGMWASNNKLYVLGGRVIVEGGGDRLGITNPSIEDFVSYDILSKAWKYEDILGSDRPHDLSEFTVLPMYTGESDEEPSSVIVWGGYGEVNKWNGPKSAEELKAHYGDESKEFALSYRCRLLRFDVETGVWKKLTPTTDVLPKAQSIAAVWKSENGIFRLLICGGYGFTAVKKDLTVGQKVIMNKYAQMVADGEAEELSPRGRSPKGSNKLYEVSILGEAFGSSFSSSRTRWCWDLHTLSYDKRPHLIIDIAPRSPTLYNALDITDEDFLPSSCDLVLPDDERKLLGVRVKLCNLKRRKDLNGQVGRCGCWSKEEKRYQVFLFYGAGESTKSSIGESTKSISVQPQNLQIAKPLTYDDLQNLIMSKSASFQKFPNVVMSIIVQIKDSRKIERPPLDEFLDPRRWKQGHRQGCHRLDFYYGPVSRRAQSILRTISSYVSESCIACMFVAFKHPKSPGQVKAIEVFTLYSNFVKQVRNEDYIHVQLLEKTVAAIDSFEANMVCGKWLKLTVQLDGIYPPIQREVLVNPEITLRDLHHHVLCPAMGWKPNFHCYAFRNCATNSGWVLNKEANNIEKECWIGPRKSTSLDSVFMPLYIGGYLANDKNITLGQLFVLNKSEHDDMSLQYVHDFGDWWSHSISVIKHIGGDGIPNQATAAYLISGSGGSIPDDAGGVREYTKKIDQLTMDVDPSSECWWDLLSGIRGHSNRLDLLTSPLEFDLEKTRTAIELDVHTGTQKAGKENINLCVVDPDTGLKHEFDENCTITLPKTKTKLCAVCGVTVALKLCSRCSGVAYCSRDHQLNHWETHKFECRQIRKQMKANANGT